MWGGGDSPDIARGGTPAIYSHKRGLPRYPANIPRVPLFFWDIWGVPPFDCISREYPPRYIRGVPPSPSPFPPILDLAVCRCRQSMKPYSKNISGEYPPHIRPRRLCCQSTKPYSKNILREYPPPKIRPRCRCC